MKGEQWTVLCFNTLWHVIHHNSASPLESNGIAFQCSTLLTRAVVGNLFVTPLNKWVPTWPLIAGHSHRVVLSKFFFLYFSSFLPLKIMLLPLRFVIVHLVGSMHQSIVVWIISQHSDRVSSCLAGRNYKIWLVWPGWLWWFAIIVCHLTWWSRSDRTHFKCHPFFLSVRHTLRFWNAAFFDAVHCERKKRSPTTRWVLKQI